MPVVFYFLTIMNEASAYIFMNMFVSTPESVSNVTRLFYKNTLNFLRKVYILPKCTAC